MCLHHPILGLNQIRPAIVPLIVPRKLHCWLLIVAFGWHVAQAESRGGRSATTTSSPSSYGSAAGHLGIARPPTSSSPQLHQAAFRGNKKRVEELLAQGTDPNIRDGEGLTPLHRAAQAGEADIALLLISKGADPNAKAENGQTPLHLTASPGVIAALASHSADLNIKDNEGKTPLDAAMANNRNASLRSLLESGVSLEPRTELAHELLWRAINSDDAILLKQVLGKGVALNDSKDDDIRLFMQAVQRSSTEVVQELLDNGANAAWRTDPHSGVSLGSGRMMVGSYTALHFAAERGSVDMIRLLITYGADVNGKSDPDKETPLHYAASGNYLDIIKLLLANGADVNAENSGGYTPLDWACSNNDRRGTKLAVEYLFKAGGERITDSLLKFAASQDTPVFLQDLLAKGANVSGHSEQIGSMLQAAASHGRMKILEFLVEKGADVNSPSKSSESCLHTAARNGSTEIVAFLIDKGVDVNSHLGFSEETPLHVAAANGRAGVAKMLLEKGANVNAKSEDGSTPAHFSASPTNTSQWNPAEPPTGTLRVLIDHGADMNAQRNDGYTPAHIAAANGYVDNRYINNSLLTLRFLADKGAILDSKTKAGQTPRDLAAEHKNTAIVQCLDELMAKRAASSPATIDNVKGR